MKESSKRNAHLLLPNLLTTASLFAGFYALIAAVQGEFTLAGWVLLIAAVFDMLDGRIARLLNAESAFGAEYDSLSDMLSFGITPAVLIYMWALSSLQQPGWVAAFAFVACAALRLARFNVQIAHQDKRYFQGLPTPGAALFIATAVIFYQEQGITPNAWFWAFISLSLAYMMVSNLRFVSGKQFNFNIRRPFVAILIMVLILGTIMLHPSGMLFLLFTIYVLHGPIMSLWQKRKASEFRLARRLRRQKKNKSNQYDDSDDKPAE
ncbi:MAG: CDP-diacylglycerol--serine O-phosphatidyltransferase [Mariprofundales bacterium]